MLCIHHTLYRMCSTSFQISICTESIVYFQISNCIVYIVYMYGFRVDFRCMSSQISICIEYIGVYILILCACATYEDRIYSLYTCTFTHVRSRDEARIKLKYIVYILVRLSTYILVMQCVAVWYSVLQCVAVCCSVLQCVAVCCSVLQGVAVCATAVCCTHTRTQKYTHLSVYLLTFRYLVKSQLISHI